MQKKWISWVGVVGILGIEYLIRNIFLPSFAKEIHVRNALIIEWILLAILLLVWLPKVENETLGSIGFGLFKWRYLWMGVIAFVVATAALIFSGFVLEENGLEPIRSLQPVLETFSGFTLFGLFITGTILEEIFYRGYLIERLSVLTGHVWLAGLVSWMAFSLVHLKFFGLGPTIDVSIISFMLVLLYMKEKSIWPCIIAHGINNALSYLVFPIIVG